MRYAVTLLALSCLATAGCQGPPKVAVAVATPEPIVHSGTSAPTVSIRGADGSATTLQAAAQPVYVVAFVHAVDSSGCGFDPALAQLADDLEPYSISVVQITQLGEDHPLAWRQPGRCPPPVKNRMLLLDPDGVAWRAFGSPEAGTLMVVDDHGQITRTGTMGDIMPVYFGARDTAINYERIQGYLRFDWPGVRYTEGWD